MMMAARKTRGFAKWRWGMFEQAEEAAADIKFARRSEATLDEERRGEAVSEGCGDA